MMCPGCKQPMIVLEIEGIEIDHCIACGGVWLDGGELELLLDAADSKNRLMAELAGGLEGKERSLRCPNCTKKMQKINYGKERKVLLDKCPQDHGLWFDKGELNDVIHLGNFAPDNRVYKLLNDVFGNQDRRP